MNRTVFWGGLSSRYANRRYADRQYTGPSIQGDLGPGATTPITAFELRSGARSPRAVTQVEELLGALVILPLDAEAAERAAEVRRELETAGTPVGMADYLIAGVCPVRSATLLTRNRAHSGRVPGMALGGLA